LQKDIALKKTPSQNYGASPAMWDLPPDTGQRAPSQPQLGRSVLDLPTPEGWKAELT